MCVCWLDRRRWWSDEKMVRLEGIFEMIDPFSIWFDDRRSLTPSWERRWKKKKRGRSEKRKRGRSEKRKRGRSKKKKRGKLEKKKRGRSEKISFLLPTNFKFDFKSSQSIYSFQIRPLCYLSSKIVNLLSWWISSRKREWPSWNWFDCLMKMERKTLETNLKILTIWSRWSNGYFRSHFPTFIFEIRSWRLVWRIFHFWFDWSWFFFFTTNNNSHLISSSTFSIFLSLEDQIEDGGVFGRCWIVNAHHSNIHQDVIVKISSNLQNLQQEHHNLLRLNSSSSSSSLVINVYDDVLELGGRYGIVLEKGGVDMERYLKSNYSHISEVHQLFLAESLVTIVRSIHQSNMVWVDCKLSNVCDNFQVILY